MTFLFLALAQTVPPPRKPLSSTRVVSSSTETACILPTRYGTLRTVRYNAVHYNAVRCSECGAVRSAAIPTPDTPHQRPFLSHRHTHSTRSLTHERRTRVVCCRSRALAASHHFTITATHLRSGPCTCNSIQTHTSIHSFLSVSLSLSSLSRSPFSPVPSPLTCLTCLTSDLICWVRPV